MEKKKTLWETSLKVIEFEEFNKVRALPSFNVFFFPQFFWIFYYLDFWFSVVVKEGRVSGKRELDSFRVWSCIILFNMIVRSMYFLKSLIWMVTPEDLHRLKTSRYSITNSLISPELNISLTGTLVRASLQYSLTNSIAPFWKYYLRGFRVTSGDLNNVVIIVSMIPYMVHKRVIMTSSLYIFLQEQVHLARL